MRLLFLSLSLLCLCYTSKTIGQEITENESSIADCIGAVEVVNFTESSIQMPGNVGEIRDLNFTKQSKIEMNSLW